MKEKVKLVESEWTVNKNEEGTVTGYTVKETFHQEMVHIAYSEAVLMAFELGVLDSIAGLEGVFDIERVIINRGWRYIFGCVVLKGKKYETLESTCGEAYNKGYNLIPSAMSNLRVTFSDKLMENEITEEEIAEAKEMHQEVIKGLFKEIFA